MVTVPIVQRVNIYFMDLQYIKTNSINHRYNDLLIHYEQQHQQQQQQPSNQQLCNLYYGYTNGPICNISRQPIHIVTVLVKNFPNLLDLFRKVFRSIE